MGTRLTVPPLQINPFDRNDEYGRRVVWAWFADWCTPAGPIPADGGGQSYAVTPDRILHYPLPQADSPGTPTADYRSIHDGVGYGPGSGVSLNIIAPGSSTYRMFNNDINGDMRFFDPSNVCVIGCWRPNGNGSADGGDPRIFNKGFTSAADDHDFLLGFAGANTTVRIRIRHAVDTTLTLAATSAMLADEYNWVAGGIHNQSGDTEQGFIMHWTDPVRIPVVGTSGGIGPYTPRSNNAIPMSLGTTGETAPGNASQGYTGEWLWVIALSGAHVFDAGGLFL